MASKDDLKRLIDQLPDDAIGQMVDFAQFLRQKEARRALGAVKMAMNELPEDDEPVAPEEAEAVAQAKASSAPRITADEARRRLLE